eukprot:1190277-Prorocentrum_minimum.AAC.4
MVFPQDHARAVAVRDISEVKIALVPISRTEVVVSILPKVTTTKAQISVANKTNVLNLENLRPNGTQNATSIKLVSVVPVHRKQHSNTMRTCVRHTPADPALECCYPNYTGYCGFVETRGNLFEKQFTTFNVQYECGLCASGHK